MVWERGRMIYIVNERVRVWFRGQGVCVCPCFVFEGDRERPLCSFTSYGTSQPPENSFEIFQVVPGLSKHDDKLLQTQLQQSDKKESIQPITALADFCMYADLMNLTSSKTAIKKWCPSFQRSYICVINELDLDISILLFYDASFAVSLWDAHPVVSPQKP